MVSSCFFIGKEDLVEVVLPSGPGSCDVEWIVGWRCQRISDLQRSTFFKLQESPFFLKEIFP